MTLEGIKNKVANTVRKEKQKQILKEITEGKRTSIYDLDITLEEFLTKDENGITFLEHLLKNKIYVGAECLKNSIEAAYVYCECDEYLFGFSFKEEELFHNKNGTRFIDYLVQKEKLTSNIVNAIDNYMEIVDILIDNNSTYLLSHLSEKIINQLITSNSNGNYPIEKYFSNNIAIRNILPLINNPKEIIKICEKNNKYELLEFANCEVLMYELKENYTLLNDLVSKNIIPYNLRIIPNDRKFINYIRTNNLYDYLKNCSESNFLIKLENGKTLLEEIIEKSNITQLNSSIKKEKTIEILYKNNKLGLAINVSEELLLRAMNSFDSKYNLPDQTLLEYMLDRNYDPLLKPSRIYKEATINILYNRGEYKLLGKKADENCLKLKMNDGTILIDKLLDNNVDITCQSIESSEILKKFYNKGRYDLLVNAKIEKLFELVNKDETYIDCVLEKIKSKQIRFNLNSIYFFGYDVNIVAKFYLAIAKHDMMAYVKELEVKDLLKEYNGKTLLNELLDIDTNLTLEKIIPKKVKNEMEIAIILKSRGIDQNNINVSNDDFSFNNEYLENKNARLGVGPLYEEGELLLKKLENLFLSDGKSDPELIKALIIGYRHALLVDYNVNVGELKNLIEIKEQNMDNFVYLKDKDNAFFRPSTGEVYAYNNVVDTLMHETGHALHLYLIDEKMPYGYENVVERVKNNPDVLKKVEKFSNEYKQIKQKIAKLVEKQSQKFFETYFTTDKIISIEEFLKESQIEKKEKFKSLGISEEILDIILRESFTVEQFINHQKRIYKEQQIDAIFRSEYGSFMAIGDILDAIYEGKLNSGFLKNENGDIIERTSGHGIAYYYDDPVRWFSEMVANFSSISKSPQSYEMLDLLKSIVGEELYDMLSTFYYTNIATLDEDQVSSSKSI